MRACAGRHRGQGKRRRPALVPVAAARQDAQGGLARAVHDRRERRDRHGHRRDAGAGALSFGDEPGPGRACRHRLPDRGRLRSVPPQLGPWPAARRDLSPFWPGTPEVRTGGGAELARFILQDIRAFLTTLTHLDPARQGLFGHSFGGLFALWLMFGRPDAFTHWIVASPSITWEESFLLAHRAAFDS